MRAAPGADDDVTAWLIKHGYDGADIVAALRENLVETFGDLAFLAPSEHDMERLGLAPGEVVFVDDAPGNVAGAEAVGIRSVLVGPTRDEVPTAIAAIEANLG